MTLPKHVWIIERNPLEAGVFLAAYGDEPGYFIQDQDGAVRGLTEMERQRVTERFGTPPQKPLPTGQHLMHGDQLRKKAALTKPYETRASSANARQYDY